MNAIFSRMTMIDNVVGFGLQIEMNGD